MQLVNIGDEIKDDADSVLVNMFVGTGVEFEVELLVEVDVEEEVEVEVK